MSTTIPALGSTNDVQPSAEAKVDIEHVPVKNDPRAWLPARKNLLLALIAGASMIAGFAGNIQNPAIADIQTDLSATSSQISLTVSLFILVQGVAPLFWTAVSEIYGRKIVYLVSLTLFCVASVVTATSKTIEILIGFRVLQAAGSSSVMAIGAATLADIFDPEERGTKMGIYYIAPLLGPALAPILGGGLATGFNWRAPFYLLVIMSGLSVLSFLALFRDTFRKERSLTYQNILKSRMKAADAKEEKRAKAEKGIPKDLEAASVAINEIKLSFSDVNPVKPMWYVLKRWNNLITLTASGILFAFTFIIVYTASRTLGSAYGYSPLKIGLVLLSFGFGCVAGSLSGGRWSDIQLARLKEANGGKSYPEMRLRSLYLGGLLVPFACCSYGWVSEQRVHVAAQCVMLFLSGFGVVWIYSSTLAYIVDSNPGRSGTATACNSLFRGIGAFVAIEVAVPLQDSVGDGWLYTIWAVLLAISSGMLILVMFYGKRWRERLDEKEMRKANQ